MLNNIVSFSIKQRVTTMMFFTGVCLIGFISLWKLPVQLLPDIEFPKLTIITSYENQSPQEIENLVTKNIEEAVGSVNGIKSVYSESIEGLSIVTATFQWGTNMNMAIIETKEKVDLIKGQLPQDTGKSIVTKFDPKDEPVLVYSVDSANCSLKKLRNRIEKEVQPFIERVDGVAAVDVIGGYRRQVNVHLDLAKISSYKLSIGEVIESINAANYSIPAGNIKYNNKEYLVRTIGEFKNIDEIGRTVVGRNDNGVPIYLEEVGTIEDGFKDQKCLIDFDGQESIAILIHKEPSKNTIQVCKNVESSVNEFLKKRGNDFRIRPVFNQSRFISVSINDVLFSAIIGGIIAVLILYFFLQEIKSPIIIATSIPISILGTFGLMYFKGISLNVMSLGGLALGVGMMVDDGVVVLEAISQAKTGRRGNKDGSYIEKGTISVIKPVVASTLTKIVVFLPITFISTLSGAVFSELALTISFALICSLISSLTLMPMLYSLNIDFEPTRKNSILSHIVKVSKSASDRVMSAILEIYRRMIDFSLNNMRKVFLSGIIVTAIGILGFIFIDSELMPKVDPGEFTVSISLPKGTAFKDTVRFGTRIESELLRKKYVDGVYTKIGSDSDENVTEKVSGMSSNDISIQVLLKGGYRPSIESIIQELKKELVFSDRIKIDFLVKESVVASLFSYTSKPLTVEIYGKDSGEISKYGQTIKRIFEKHKEIENISMTLDDGYPELGLRIDRGKMASLSVDIYDVASTLRMAVNGESATKYRISDDEIDVRVKLQDDTVLEKENLGAILVKTKGGDNIPLSKFAEIDEGVGPSKIIHSDQSRVNILSANVTKNRDAVFNDVEDEISKIRFADGYEAKLVGEKKEIRKTFSELVFAFILGIVLIYMVLSSEFQSFKNPLIIMLSIPVASLGVSGSLLLTGNTLNINSGIGIILLAGTVVNNSIVLFDFIDIEFKRSNNLRLAIIEAGKRRIKPILITTCTTIFGMIPLALGIGEGGELQQSMAVAVIGGLFFSTFLTLVFIPTIYAMVNDK